MTSTTSQALPTRILTLFGTRPEAIKVAPVIHELGHDPQFDVTVAVSGQHRDLVDSILEPFEIRIEHDLQTMVPGQSLTEIVGKISRRTDALCDELKPQILLVQGDTTSAFGAALAAFHRGIPVAHVEAGLRSYDRNHPFPEESNRRMISTLSSVHMAPTPASADNLLREGIPDNEIFVTGNTAVDALHYILERIEGAAGEHSETESVRPVRPRILVTLHRRECWADPLDAPAFSDLPRIEDLLLGLREAAVKFSELDFLYPVHPNPRVRQPAREILSDLPNFTVIDALPYVPFVQEMARSRVIVTDSGGIQEEAPSLGVPVIVLREKTERPEGEAWGTTTVAGTDPSALIPALETALATEAADPAGRPFPNPFGDGRAAERIRQALLCSLGRGPKPGDFVAPPRQTPSHTHQPSPKENPK